MNSGFERATFLANLDAQATDRLKLGLNLFGSRGTRDGVTTQSDGSVTVGNDDVIGLAMRFAPDRGIFREDGTFTTNDAIGDELDNPYAVATQRVDETTTDEFRANVYGELDIFENLTFKSTFGVSTQNETRGIYQPSTLQITAGGAGGRAIVTNAKRTTLISENYLTYTNRLGNGDLTLLRGY